MVSLQRKAWGNLESIALISCLKSTCHRAIKQEMRTRKTSDLFQLCVSLMEPKASLLLFHNLNSTITNMVLEPLDMFDNLQALMQNYCDHIYDTSIILLVGNTHPFKYLLYTFSPCRASFHFLNLQEHLHLQYLSAIRPKSNQLGIARYLVFCVDKDFKMEGSSLEMEDASHGLEWISPF
jgi:hypothetical protein